MGAPTAQVQSSTQPQGKGAASTPDGTKGQQPAFGQPNQYSNTVGNWQTPQIQSPQQSTGKSGKGQSWQPFQAPTDWNTNQPATQNTTPVAQNNVQSWDQFNAR